MMGKTLYLECYSGISGDMTVGALLDLGAREEALREALVGLPLDGYEIKIGRAKKCGIDACDFEVLLEEEQQEAEAAHHMHGAACKHRHGSESHWEAHHAHSSASEYRPEGNASSEEASHTHGPAGVQHHHGNASSGKAYYLYGPADGHRPEGSVSSEEVYHPHGPEGGHRPEGNASSGETAHTHGLAGEYRPEGNVSSEEVYHTHSSAGGHHHGKVFHEEVSHPHGPAGAHHHEDASQAEHFHTPHSHGGHAHYHRHYRDIMEMLDQASLKPEVRELAKKIFYIVGKAEAKVHACPLEEVHFHETGAVDSIVDIVGAAACAVDLGITDTYVSTLHEGQGHVWCQHGRIPVPAPAVAEILSAGELPLKVMSVEGEMITPTGAAIAAALRTKEGSPSSFRIQKIGLGAGKKDFPHANILRAMLIEETSNTRPSHDTERAGTEENSGQDEIWVLETNLDDISGEALGFTLEQLMEAGARDVSYTPIFMKKNRPAYKLEILCKEDKVPVMENLVFTHTTAIGLRKRREERRILPRKIITVQTPYGEAKIKICRRDTDEAAYPEYESVRRIAAETGRPFQEIYHSLVEEAWKKKEAF